MTTTRMVAYEKGAQDWDDGKPRDANPYTDEKSRQGWDDAWDDNDAQSAGVDWDEYAE
jgi:ribosome modulation factor